MIDFENSIFNQITLAIREKFSGIYVVGEAVSSPAKFPAVTIVEESNTDYIKSQDNNSLENHAELLYTVNIYSNLSTGKKTQAKQIRNFIDEKFHELGFTKTFSQPITNLQDTSTYRITMRFKAVVSADGMIYTN